jgi:GMP synthase-like glutamine amidotransferase
MHLLRHSLAGHEVEVQLYEPGIKFNYEDKDLAILSGGGGEGRELHDKVKPTNRLWYEDEMKFVHNCKKPIIGICMGFEVIATAFGAKLSEMPVKGIEEYQPVKTTLKGFKKFKIKNLKQFEGHDYCIKDVPAKHFEVLAKSETGIEIIKHKSKPIIAMQFHPEFPNGTIHLKHLLKAV